jgi:hypothetical protein
VKVDLSDLEGWADENGRVTVDAEELAALIRVARAAKAYIHGVEFAKSLDEWTPVEAELHAALSQVEDSANG